MILGCKVSLRCGRCGKIDEDYPDLHFEMVPTQRAFMSYKNPTLAKHFIGERIFDLVCNECFSEKDQRVIERFDNDYDLRNQSSAPNKDADKHAP